MKKLYDTITASIIPYPRDDEESIIGLDPKFLVLDVINETIPSYDNNVSMVLSTETVDIVNSTIIYGWNISPIPSEKLALDALIKARKIWKSSGEFLQEFSMPQLAAISLSVDPTVAALRLILLSWTGELWSDDPRVTHGLDSLVSSGIITSDDRAGIVTPV
jgi:hypothetical protein